MRSTLLQNSIHKNFSITETLLNVKHNYIKHEQVFHFTKKEENLHIWVHITHNIKLMLFCYIHIFVNKT